MNNPTEARYGARVFWSDADAAYIAVTPEFDGVSASGATVADAIAELQVALELTMQTFDEEGWELPPPNVEPEYSGQFRLRLPKTLHQWLASTAESEGVSLNTLAVQLLAEARGGTEATDRAAGRMQAVEASLRASIEGAQAVVVAARQEAANAQATWVGSAGGYGYHATLTTPWYGAASVQSTDRNLDN